MRFFMLESQKSKIDPNAISTHADWERDDEQMHEALSGYIIQENSENRLIHLHSAFVGRGNPNIFESLIGKRYQARLKALEDELETATGGKEIQLREQIESLKLEIDQAERKFRVRRANDVISPLASKAATQVAHVDQASQLWDGGVVAAETSIKSKCADEGLLEAVRDDVSGIIMCSQAPIALYEAWRKYGDECQNDQRVFIFSGSANKTWMLEYIQKNDVEIQDQARALCESEGGNYEDRLRDLADAKFYEFLGSYQKVMLYETFPALGGGAEKSIDGRCYPQLSQEIANPQSRRGKDRLLKIQDFNQKITKKQGEKIIDTLNALAQVDRKTIFTKQNFVDLAKEYAAEDGVNIAEKTDDDLLEMLFRGTLAQGKQERTHHVRYRMLAIDYEMNLRNALHNYIEHSSKTLEQISESLGITPEQLVAINQLSTTEDKVISLSEIIMSKLSEHITLESGRVISAADDPEAKDIMKALTSGVEKSITKTSTPYTVQRWDPKDSKMENVKPERYANIWEPTMTTPHQVLMADQALVVLLGQHRSEQADSEFLSRQVFDGYNSQGYHQYKEATADSSQSLLVASSKPTQRGKLAAHLDKTMSSYVHTYSASASTEAVLAVEQSMSRTEQSAVTPGVQALVKRFEPDQESDSAEDDAQFRI